MCALRTRPFAFLRLITALLMMTPVMWAQGAVATPGGFCTAYKTIPLPPEAESIAAPRMAPACASYRSYKGLGRSVKFAEARACAWQERLAQQADLGQNDKEPLAWVVGGSLILSDLYANGAGVDRNLPLAMRFACEFEEQAAPFAWQRLQQPTTAGKPFELCDDAYTTFAANFCMAYQVEISDDRRHRAELSLQAHMTSPQRAAFQRLLSARDAYLGAHSEEVDQGGSMRTMRAMGSAEILVNLFRAELRQFEKRQFPGFGAKRSTAIDTDLQHEYRATLDALRARTPADTYDGAVTAEAVAKVQAAWLPFVMRGRTLRGSAIRDQPKPSGSSSRRIAFGC